MRELELAGYPSMNPPHGDGRSRHPLARPAVVVSILAHLLAAYALSLHDWAVPSPPPPAIADFFLFELPAPRNAESASDAAPVEAAPEVEAREAEVEAVPPPRVTEPEPSVVETPRVVVPAPEAEGERAAPLVPASEAVRPAEDPRVAEPLQPAPLVDFDEERRRAARDVVSERSQESEYLTFSMDDVAPPRPEAQPERKSIFDLNTPPSGRSVMQPGQQRTKVGRKLAELCNALTGGFTAAFQGFRLFSACGSPELGPSGLYPEVRPAYLDLMPECEDTRDTAPALALEAPFSTVKCRLVKRDTLAE